jgi:hypothetical protein
MHERLRANSGGLGAAVCSGPTAAVSADGGDQAQADIELVEGKETVVAPLPVSAVEVLAQSGEGAIDDGFGQVVPR